MNTWVTAYTEDFQINTIQPNRITRDIIELDILEPASYCLDLGCGSCRNSIYQTSIVDFNY